jgi:hypothetical protein
MRSNRGQTAAGNIIDWHSRWSQSPESHDLPTLCSSVAMAHILAPSHSHASYGDRQGSRALRRPVPGRRTPSTPSLSSMAMDPVSGSPPCSLVTALEGNICNPGQGRVYDECDATHAPECCLTEHALDHDVYLKARLVEECSHQSPAFHDRDFERRCVAKHAAPDRE